MAHSTDGAQTGHPARTCTYCPDPDPDACIRMIPSAAGPDRSVYAHQACAQDRGVRPLYLVEQPVVALSPAEPWPAYLAHLEGCADCQAQKDRKSVV